MERIRRITLSVHLAQELAYDDGCHMLRFSESRKNSTPKAKIFWKKNTKTIMKLSLWM